jgi:hypothetical protein
VSTGRVRVGMGSVGLKKNKVIEAPEASKPDFTGVTVPQTSPSNVGGRGVELGPGGSGGQSGT